MNIKKTTQFRNLLTSPELEFICEAHNGLSAKIVEEAGFKGIWGSGLSISAQFGVRDNNEASWTQVVDQLEFMSDATSIPILLDGDTGYGNFNNMRRLVHKLEQRDIAAVCIEDKIFPKTNSFIGGESQELANIDEFCGKIKAGKDAQKDDDFTIVARVEAFIAGWGLKEALRRSEAYHAAGADAILMHSALRKPDEILAFKKEWGDRCPVIIVPTKYYQTPTDVFREYGISLVIWANHLMRAAITSMQQTARTIYEDENLLSVEDKVATIPEVFRIQGADELADAEKVYLPSTDNSARAIILAASRGSELGELTANIPKAMVEIKGKPLLELIADTYRAVGISDITAVRGYAKDTVNLKSIKYVDNDDHENTGELVSLELALNTVDNERDLIISYGDVLFNKYIAQWLAETEADFILPVDENWRESANKHRQADLVHCSEANSRLSFTKDIKLAKISDELAEADTHGEWMGFFKVSKSSLPMLKETLKNLLMNADNKRAKMPILINKLIEDGQSVKVLYTSGHWLDIDTAADVVSAGNF
ncbi:MAG TPA: phosphoenolpyruvate mutase [Gammaproteobacteria bacterium]|nr:phosphoenolpyruvate mutase [Gammaproteobacteria bacterium]